MLENIFHELNSAHFNRLLPLPRLSWNARLTSTAGRFCPGSRRIFPPTPAEIEVATYLRKIPDGGLHVRDTLLHEMIHYFLWHQKRPHGHTPEFHAILKRVGAKRYNTVPQLWPIKYWYECPACHVQVPARRKKGPSACAECCGKFNRGKYHERFRLVALEKGASKLAPPSQAELPTKQAATGEQCIPPGELIRRLEALKGMLRSRATLKH